MKALLLALKKIITVIVAVLLPATQVAPPVATVFYGQAEAYSIQNEAPETEEEEEYDIVEDIQPTEDPEEAPQPEAAENNYVAPVEENNAQEYTAVQTWDVSATEDDNVIMAFYDTEDVEGLLAQLAGRVTALFAPMVAYAAEDDEEEKVAGLEVFYEDGYLDRGTDYGNGEGVEPQEPEYYDRGTVVVFGEGKMQDYVYNYFMTADKYFEVVADLFDTLYGIEAVPTCAEEDKVDVVQVFASTVWHDANTGEVLEITPEMEERLNPEDLLAFSPTVLIIEDGVTSISEYAFFACSNIVQVEIPNSVKTIGNDAFGQCRGLTELTIPASVESISYWAFAYCTNLQKVTIEGNLNEVGYWAFAELAPNAVIECPNQTVKDLFVPNTYTGNTTVVIAE